MKHLLSSLFLLLLTNIAQAQNNTSSITDIDACRIDNSLPPAIATAAKYAWGVAISQSKITRDIAINPRDAVTSQPIFFIKDSLLGSKQCPSESPDGGDGSFRVFDAQTVPGLCNARNGVVVCSSDAIRALLEIERQFQKNPELSPTLVYVFAHEFGHILLNHPGAFSEGVTRISFAPNRGENIANFVQTCELDPSQVQREEEADNFAFKVTKQLFSNPPFQASDTSVIQSVLTNSEVIYWTGKIFSAWAGKYYGTSSEYPFPKARKLCGLLERTQGSIIFPVYGGTHPQTWSRLATIVNQAGEYINTLRAEDRQSLSDGTDAFIGMNRLTDIIMAKALDATAAAFCKRVSNIENGTLNCSNLPEDPDGEESESISIDSGKHTNSLSLPITFSPSGSYREILDGSPWVLVFATNSINGAPTQDLAIEEAKKMMNAYEKFLSQLDGLLKKNGGYWIRERHTPVEVRYTDLSYGKQEGGDYTSSVKTWGIVRVPPYFDIKKLSAIEDIKRWGRVDDIHLRPWNDSSHEVVIHFFRTGTNSANKDSQRIITRRLKFDEIFDLDAARNDHKEKPATFFRDLLPFLYSRLKNKFGGEYTLEGNVFYITSSGMGDNFDLPTDWEYLINSSYVRTTSDDTLSKGVDRVYINNSTEENAKDIFRE